MFVERWTDLAIQNQQRNLFRIHATLTETLNEHQTRFVLVNDWLNIPQKRAPVKVPRIVLSLSLSENRRRESLYAHPLTGIYAVREWRMPTLG